MSEITKQRIPLQFHGRTLFAFVMKAETPVGRWLADASEWISRSPGFFDGRPVILDVSSTLVTENKLARLVSGLASRGIRVMAIVGAQQSNLAQTLPPLLTNSQALLTPIEASDPGDQFVPDGAAQQISSPLVIDAPVRSGQSILHQGDITIFGSVSSGAEIVATGSIHIYGTLRGSIMAGAEGNAKAHIYCQRLEAELLSINGYYSTADGIEPHLMGSAVHARLQDDTLEIRALN